MDGSLAITLIFVVLSVSSPALAKRSTRHLGYYRSPSGSSPVETPPSGSSPSGSSPVFSPPYSSTPSSGSPSSSFGPVASPFSSPIVGSPTSSPIIGSPTSSSSPIVGSPFASPISPISSPVIGSPSSSPFVSSPGAPLVTPVIGTPTPPSTGNGGGYGGRGSCGFWRNRAGKWPGFLSRLASIGSIFGGRSTTIFGSRMTLMQALVNSNEDGYSELARQGTASLLNAYAFTNFAYTPNEVLDRFNEALDDSELARQQAQMFELANSGV